MKRRCDLLTVTAPHNMTAAVLEAGMGVVAEDLGGDSNGSGAEEDYQGQQDKRIGKTAVEALGKVPRGM